MKTRQHMTAEQSQDHPQQHQHDIPSSHAIRSYTSALINASTDMETGTETVHGTSECVCNAK
ncbi:hypothetical protein NEUTE1DRAFT_97778 [Neurospora tetrasperma FGSC 2508]|uniref:Uncharacterized protein n=1 Tax=Neurospora tetrasperma (strain FGSC 2508 / ATCC MYA-4615 / P0657) TaxID=510951 RepID=F8MDC0_NEUT8|nr:uncharacterized protein NEUTE1DRAFT_97778 [Neurospora tetrasperma FGSC 2508]EGO60612.1 hypothetical protein NEUTE1DRAFT_97778 [Neurospora tetrasperma FGSC 2508]